MKKSLSECFKANQLFAMGCYLALLFFSAGFFFLQSSKQLNNFFYIAIAVPALGICIFSKSRSLIACSYFKALVLLLAWIFFSGLLNIEFFFDYLQEVKPFLYVFLCSVAIFFVSKKRPDLPVTFMYTILFAACFSGLFFLYSFYEPRGWNFLGRLKGYGAVSNPIWIGAIYGLAALISILLFFYKKGTKHRMLILLLGAIPLLVLLATQSRGPMVALLVSFVYAFMLFWKKSVRQVLVLALVGLAVAGLGYNLVKEHTRIFSGDEYRTAIWSNAVSRIQVSPLIGHGIDKETINTVGEKSFKHFHNTYLTLAYHSGLIGLLLFLFLTFRPFFYQETRYDKLLKPLIVFGLIYMLFNGSRLFTGPKELWLIFWLPLIMLWATTRYQSGSSCLKN